MKKWAMLIWVLVLVVGCRSDGRKRGVTGGTPEENAMMVAALENAYQEQVRLGNGDVIKPWSGRLLKLNILPSVGTARTRGGPQGMIAPNVYDRTYGTSRVDTARPISGSTLHHAGTHVLMHQVGLYEESQSHDPTYFPAGGVVH